jgi:hypothetical protein
MYYGRKQNKDPLAAPSETIDKTWKDGIDLIRYGSVWLHNKSYSELLELLHDKQSGSSGGDYAKLQAGRELDVVDNGIPSYKLKGRTLDTRW